MSLDPEDLEAAFHKIWPVERSHVSREELMSKLQTLELKIRSSELAQRGWILTGCLAIVVTFGSGYVSLISKIDMITQTLPVLVAVQDGRRGWIVRKDRQDAHQDSSLQKVDKDYHPIDPGETPR